MKSNIGMINHVVLDVLTNIIDFIKTTLVYQKIEDKMKKGEVIVKVQRMFPNCEKYKPCCAGVEGHEILENGELGKKVIKDMKTKKIKPVDKNPFPDDEEW